MIWPYVMCVLVSFDHSADLLNLPQLSPGKAIKVAEEKSDSEQQSILTLKRFASAHPVHQLDDENVG